MKYHNFYFIIISLILLNFYITTTNGLSDVDDNDENDGDLPPKGPPVQTDDNEKDLNNNNINKINSYDRKNDIPTKIEQQPKKTLETKSTTNDNDDKVKTTIEKSLFTEEIREDLNFQNSIKIIKSQEKDMKMVNDIISELLDNQEKIIQKIETEIEEIDNKANNPIENLIEMTPEQIDANLLYESAMKSLNKSRFDRSNAYLILNQASQLGHIKARAEIAWAKLLGYIKLDIESAKETFIELSKLGVPEAHMGLGFMHATGIGFNVSQAKAIVHYTVAALGGNTYAQMALGYRFWSGISVPNSCESALEYYRRVAAKVASQVTFSGGTAVHRVRLLDEVESSGLSSGILDNDLIEYYQLLADKGDVQAQIGLGQLHYQGGRGIPLDHQKALQYFTQAANAGNAVAMAFLGKIYLEGTENVKPDNDTAFKFFKKAADLNNPVGQSGLGIMYLQGKGVVKDTAKALNYFMLAADQGWVDGQLQLGNMYFCESKFKIRTSFY